MIVTKYLSFFLFHIGCYQTLAAVSSTETTTTSSEKVSFRLYPRRTVEEAAVLEWGNSAIITALDASVALFGPQTRDAALLEVETAPVLAVPLDGLRASAKQQYQEHLRKISIQEHVEKKVEEMETNSDIDDSAFEVPVVPLDNADEVVGNLCIMTTHPGVTGVELALMAQLSGAAAVLVVNTNDPRRPDDVYRLPGTKLDGTLDPRAELVDIPVVMISLNSAQMLATAMLDPEAPDSHELARTAGFSAKYMPERIRLYAGDDRPFFEDVEAVRPTVYLIHDLLKPHECDTLIRQAETAGLSPIGKTNNNDDWLQYTSHPHHYLNIDRVTIWQGMLLSAPAKQIEDRMEQVTSFPVTHYSDFVVDRLKMDGSSQIRPHYDVLTPTLGRGDSAHNNNNNNNNNNLRSPAGFHGPVASMTIFLSDLPPNSQGGEVVYPSVSGSVDSESKRKKRTRSSDPIKIQPRKGMAVIHHNTDERGHLDATSIHALLPVFHNETVDGYFYVAHKYIFMDPLSKARRWVLPLLALPFRGKLPQVWVVIFHWFVQQFGYDTGSQYFDKACIFVPVLLILLLVQYIVDRVKQFLANNNNSNNNNNNKTSTDSSDTNAAAESAAPKRKKRAKRD